MKRLQNLIFYVLIVGLLSCNLPTDYKTIKEGKTSNLKNLAGQVFYYAPGLDASTCKAIGACDCCSGNIYFINDSVFLSVDICESNTNYSKGLYRIDNNILILSTDSLKVDKEYNWEKETDTTGAVMKEYFINQSKTPTSTQKLTRHDCKDNLFFVMGDREKYFVTPDKDVKLSEFIGQLKKDGIWAKLEMK